MPINVKDVMEKGTEVQTKPKGNNIELVKKFFAKKEAQGQFFTQAEVTKAVSEMAKTEKHGPAIRSALHSIMDKGAKTDAPKRLVRRMVDPGDGTERWHYGFVDRDQLKKMSK